MQIYGVVDGVSERIGFFRKNNVELQKVRKLRAFLLLLRWSGLTLEGAVWSAGHVY